MEEVLQCAFYIAENREWTYLYDVQFTEVGPAISNLMRRGHDLLQIGDLQILESAKTLYECTVE